tara:strand:+ start:605 stop:775 length:171 start_codon:yes stop_codon:yes gene_type:complete
MLTGICQILAFDQIKQDVSLYGKKVADAKETGEASIIYSDPTLWCWKLIPLLKNFK